MKSLVRSKRGFTLIETLISILLLGIILVGGMALYFNAEKIMTLALHKKIATELANSEIEKYKKTSYGNLVAGQSASDVVLGSLNAKVSNGLGMTVTIQEIDEPPEDTIIDYKEVTVHIKWREVERSTNNEIQLTTLIAP